MLPKRTCLLLGAGASKHLGFPLGDELRKMMLDELFEQKDKKHKDLPEDFHRGDEDLAAFYDKLAHGGWNSPDAFLEQHQEFVQTGKYLICKCLSKFEKPEYLIHEGGWYDRLVSSIHVDAPRMLKENNLSIVTFNYDRSIDFKLHMYIQHRFGMSSDEALQMLTDSIPIVHVHGMLGEYPKWDYGNISSVWERGQNIKIISEIGEGSAEFQRASKLLNDAERVVVFGFGFAPDNVRRLNYFKKHDKEDRDIIVATGSLPGNVRVEKNKRWLAHWGLERNKHHYTIDVNNLFDFCVDPFE